MKNKIAIEFFGAPGSGKDTQRNIFEKYLVDKNKQVCSFDTGSSLRELKKKNKCVGKAFEGIVDSGYLLPDAFSITNITNFLLENCVKYDYFLLSGSSRNPTQAKILIETLKSLSFNTFYLINLKVSDDVLIDRIKRRLDDRTDNRNEEIIKRRLDIFYKSLDKILNTVKEYEICKVLSFDGGQEIGDIHKEIIQKIKI